MQCTFPRHGHPDVHPHCQSSARKNPVSSEPTCALKSQPNFSRQSLHIHPILMCGRCVAVISMPRSFVLSTNALQVGMRRTRMFQTPQLLSARSYLAVQGAVLRHACQARHGACRAHAAMPFTRLHTPTRVQLARTWRATQVVLAAHGAWHDSHSRITRAMQGVCILPLSTLPGLPSIL